MDFQNLVCIYKEFQEKILWGPKLVPFFSHQWFAVDSLLFVQQKKTLSRLSLHKGLIF